MKSKKVRRLLATLVGISTIVAVCGACGASPVASRYTVTETAVCHAFNAAASPLAHTDSVDIVLGKLAADARNANIRRAGTTLLKDFKTMPPERIKAFERIATICVAKGLTPKDWAGLA
jgi:hypothetical protein